MSMTNRQDKLTLQRIETLHPALREEVRDLYLNRITPALTGQAMCRFAYTFRGFEEQAALYSQGRTRLFDAQGKRLGVVTNAKAGLSYHQYGLALDIVLLVDKDNNGTWETASWNTLTDFDKDGLSDWLEIVNIFKSAGWVWGGSWTKFPDRPHFEKTFGIPVKECLRRYISKEFLYNTQYIRL